MQMGQNCIAKMYSLLMTLSFSAVCLGHAHFDQIYPFSATLSENNYYLYWNFSLVDETIQFAVKVKTTGWVGFGISPNGQMPGSDVVIGWVDGDKAYFHDRYAESRSLPPIDDMQDWFLISAAINDGYTELEFSRNFTTCDNESRDLPILADTSRVVYSWNDNKPTVTGESGSETYSILPHEHKASASINLLGGLPNAPVIPSNALEFTVGVSNATLPSSDTTYWCKGLSMADLIENPDDLSYIIQFGPSLSEGSKEYVHHMLVYTCNGLSDTEDLGGGGNCHEQSERIDACRGGEGVLIAAWAVGGIPFTYPENVAYPIGGASGHKYFVIEMHYNNPERHSGVIDSSGITFTYLSESREYDAGIMFLGHQVSYYMAIPPKADNYTVSAYCPPICSETYFPSGGIKIFANMLHTHLAGTGLSLSVIREKNNEYESRPVDKNLKYDFNFQQATHLPEEISVLPGDGLVLNCFYDTSSRDTATLGGESTEEEMCLSFPIYYPRIEQTHCESVPAFDTYFNFVVNEIPADQQAAFAPLLNDGFTQTDVENALNQVDWDNELANNMSDYVYTQGKQNSYCLSSSTNVVTRTSQIPAISSYYSSPAPVRNCTVGDGASLVHLSAVVLLIVTALSSYLLLN